MAWLNAVLHIKDNDMATRPKKKPTVYKSISAAQKAGSLYFTGKDGKKKLAVTKEQLAKWKQRNKGKFKGSALTAWANAKGKDVKPLRPRARPDSLTLVGGGQGVRTVAEQKEIDRENKLLREAEAKRKGFGKQPPLSQARIGRGDGKMEALRRKTDRKSPQNKAKAKPAANNKPKPEPAVDLRGSLLRVESPFKRGGVAKSAIFKAWWNKNKSKYKKSDGSFDISKGLQAFKKTKIFKGK